MLFLEGRGACYSRCKVVQACYLDRPLRSAIRGDSTGRSGSSIQTDDVQAEEFRDPCPDKPTAGSCHGGVQPRLSCCGCFVMLLCYRCLCW